MYFLFFQWPEKKLAKRLEWMCKRKNPKEEELKELKDQLMFKHVDSLRKDQLRRLKEWQDEVNQLDQKAIKITVEKTTPSNLTLNTKLSKGSALSCTLFLIFINDLPNLLNVSKDLFADDLVMWTSGYSSSKCIAE